MAKKKDYSQLTQEEISKLSPDEFKEFTAHLLSLKNDLESADQAKATAEEKLATLESEKSQAEAKLSELESAKAEADQKKEEAEAKLSEANTKLEAASGSAEELASAQRAKEEAEQKLADAVNAKVEAENLLKEQAEQIKTSESVSAETKPTASHKIDGKTVTVRVNVKKFKHLDKESGMWKDYTAKDIQDSKNGPSLIKQLIDGGSNVITIINKSKK